MTIEKKFFAFFATYKNQILPGKNWFIAYYVPDYVTGKMKKKKYFGEINKYDTVEHRLNECYKIKLLIDQNKPLPDYRGARRLQPIDLERNFASTIAMLKSALNERKIDIDPTTYINYNSMITTLELWLNSIGMADITIGKFDEDFARDFLNYLKRKKLSNKTHNNYKVIFGSLWKDIIRNLKPSIKIENVWSNIKSLKKNTQPFKVYNNEIEKIVAKELPNFDKQLWLFVLFTHYGFIRGTENRKLKIDAIDFQSQTITIKSIVSKVSEQRIITIPDHLFTVIMALKLYEYPKDYFIFSSKGHPSIKPASKNYFSNKFNKFRINFDIPSDYKIYPFKHTGMIKANRSGVGVKEIQQQTGHHSLDQVNDYLVTMNTDTLDNLRDNFPKLGEIVSTTTAIKNDKNNDELREWMSLIAAKLDIALP